MSHKQDRTPPCQRFHRLSQVFLQAEKPKIRLLTSREDLRLEIGIARSPTTQLTPSLAAQIYRLKTLSFSATLECVRLTIYAVATLGLKLMATNFCDGFILTSQPGLIDSSKNTMKLLLLLTGWDYVPTGKKVTPFNAICRALRVEFNFSR